jgi:hypothetical protein
VADSEVLLKLDPDFRQRVDDEIIRRCQSAVQGSIVRDQIIRQYSLQVDGLSQPFTSGPWSNSCQVDDPLTIEHVIGQVSWIKAAIQGDPRVMLDSISPDD